MGYVYLANDRKVYNRLCIIKQVKERVRTKADRAKLQQEAVRMAGLYHPNVASIYEDFVERGYYFLVVQYIEGRNLNEVLEERGGKIGEAEAVNWAVSMCDVISYIHREGVIHRDISPDNIMLTPDNTIMFIDFGTMRDIQEISSGGTAGAGKFGFTPLEQWLGRPVPQSDIFAIGATIYYLLTGYLPVTAEYKKTSQPEVADYRPEFPPIRTKRPSISRKLEEILQRALSIEVSTRYQAAQELKTGLAELQGFKVARRPVRDIEKKKPSSSSRIRLKINPKIWAGIAAVILLSVAVTGIVLIYPRIAQREKDAPLTSYLKASVIQSDNKTFVPSDNKSEESPQGSGIVLPKVSFPSKRYENSDYGISLLYPSNMVPATYLSKYTLFSASPLNKTFPLLSVSVYDTTDPEKLIEMVVEQIQSTTSLIITKSMIKKGETQAVVLADGKTKAIYYNYYLQPPEYLRFPGAPYKLDRLQIQVGARTIAAGYSDGAYGFDDRLAREILLSLTINKNDSPAASNSVTTPQVSKPANPSSDNQTQATNQGAKITPPRVSFSAKTYVNNEYGIIFLYPESMISAAPTAKYNIFEAAGMTRRPAVAVSIFNTTDNTELMTMGEDNLRSVGGLGLKTIDSVDTVLSDGKTKAKYLQYVWTFSAYNCITYSLAVERGDKTIGVAYTDIDNLIDEETARKVLFTLTLTDTAQVPNSQLNKAANPLPDNQTKTTGPPTEK
jgi:serine/threonine protein kinase